MLKKHIAIVILCVANFLMIGHSIIPHNHTHFRHSAEHVEHHVLLSANDHSHQHSKHEHKHQDNGQSENEDHDFSDLFEFYSSSSEYINGSDLNLSHTGTDLTQGNLTPDCPLTICSVSENPDLKTEYFQYRDPDLKPPHSLYCGLRAPPLFFT